jgi:hypothetical protein
MSRHDTQLQCFFWTFTTCCDDSWNPIFCSFQGEAPDTNYYFLSQSAGNPEQHDSTHRMMIVNMFTHHLPQPSLYFLTLYLHNARSSGYNRSAQYSHSV